MSWLKIDTFLQRSLNNSFIVIVSNFPTNDLIVFVLVSDYQLFFSIVLFFSNFANKCQMPLDLLFFIFYCDIKQ